MKKTLLLALLAGALFASCSKEQTERVRTFDYSMGNSMYTKSVQASDVLSVIEDALPTSINLVLTSHSTGKYFNTKTNEGVMLPSDTYSVNGSWGSEPVSNDVIVGRSAYLTHAPKITIKQDLEVTDEQTDYTLSAYYSSFALVVDSEEVDRCEVTTASGSQAVSFVESGDSRVVFAQGDYSQVYLIVKVYPKDTERYETTTYTLSTAQHSGTGFVEYGKWYKLTPTASGHQPKVVGYELPTFEQGTL